MSEMLLSKAIGLIKAATSGPAIDRSAALQWKLLHREAKGDAKAQIGYMSEALVTAATSPDDQWWIATLLEIDASVPTTQIGRQMQLAEAEKRSTEALLAHRGAAAPTSL
jgi:hypothetical protein